MDINIREDHWVVTTDHSGYGDDYGVKQDADLFTLYIVSGCCQVVIVPRTTTFDAECSACGTIYHIAAMHPEDKIEDTPFQLYWGRFSWDYVEDKVKTWLDYYFNLSGGGKSVEIRFDGKTAMERYEGL